MSRRTARAWLVVSFVVVAGVVAGGLVLAFGRGGGGGPTRAAYLAEVDEICRRYEARLGEIAPPDITIPGSVVESVDAALPLIRARIAETRAAEPPAELRQHVDRFLALNDSAMRLLQRLREIALTRDLPRSAGALDAYIEARNEARAEAARIGFRC